MMAPTRGSNTATATMLVLYFLVLAARNERPIPENVLIAPGGIASKAVFLLSKPRPWIMSVLKVVRPPLGTWRATMANQMSQVLGSRRPSRI